MLFWVWKEKQTKQVMSKEMQYKAKPILEMFPIALYYPLVHTSPAGQYCKRSEPGINTEGWEQCDVEMGSRNHQYGGSWLRHLFIHISAVCSEMYA